MAMTRAASAARSAQVSESVANESRIKLSSSGSKSIRGAAAATPINRATGNQDRLKPRESSENIKPARSHPSPGSEIMSSNCAPLKPNPEAINSKNAPAAEPPSVMSLDLPLLADLRGSQRK